VLHKFAGASLTLYAVLPWAAAALLILWGVATLAGVRTRHAWRFPALLCGLFLGWSVLAIVREGPFGFWTEHTRNAWGVQIWFDLLIAVGTAWTLLLPHARSVGMRVVPWTLLVVASGGIGLMAMVSRFLYLRESGGGPT
jgi:hypothetical protein